MFLRGRKGKEKKYFKRLVDPEGDQNVGATRKDVGLGNLDVNSCPTINQPAEPGSFTEFHPLTNTDGITQITKV